MTPSAWFWTGAEPVLRTAVVGVCAYVALLLALRLSGKRTLSKFNAFDLVVTVALGSILASILVSPDTALAQGSVAFVTLIVLQAVVARLSARSRRVEAIVKSSPRLLLHRGRLLHDAMADERVSDEAVEAAVRQAGLAGLEDAEAVVLESNGELTCIPRSARNGAPATRSVIPETKGSLHEHA